MIHEGDKSGAPEKMCCAGLAFMATVSSASSTGARALSRLPAPLTDRKLDQVEGKVPPLVAVGVMTATRFIVQRTVSQAAATSVVRGGGSVLAANRQQAAQIARAASNGGARPIREYHAGPGARYTHYHPNPRNGGHVWYGQPR